MSVGPPSRPGHDVMGVAPAGRGVTAGEHAAAVADDERPTLCGGGGADGASGEQRGAGGGVDDDRLEPCVAGEHRCGAVVDGLAVDAAHPRAAAFVVADLEDRFGARRRGGRGVAGHTAADQLGERTCSQHTAGRERPAGQGLFADRGPPLPVELVAQRPLHHDRVVAAEPAAQVELAAGAGRRGHGVDLAAVRLGTVDIGSGCDDAQIAAERLERRRVRHRQQLGLGRDEHVDVAGVAHRVERDCVIDAQRPRSDRVGEPTEAAQEPPEPHIARRRSTRPTACWPRASRARPTRSRRPTRRTRRPAPSPPRSQRPTNGEPPPARAPSTGPRRRPARTSPASPAAPRPRPRRGRPAPHPPQGPPSRDRPDADATCSGSRHTRPNAATAHPATPQRRRSSSHPPTTPDRT